MNQIKCPKCGEIFSINEEDYASISKQIKDHEYRNDIARIEKQYKKEAADAVELAKIQSKESFNDELNKKETEIVKLKAELEKKDSDNKLILANEISKINNELMNKESTIKELSSKLMQKDTEIKLAVSEVVNKKDQEISKIRANSQIMEEGYKKEIANKDEMIAQYKDFKLKLSTKMVGESLEQHCANEFNKLRPLFPNAYFDKDNALSKDSQSKGDFIFKDYDNDGTEIVSIMFEMKNENDETVTKQKNEHFFKELDKDRKEKHCEYAVLVSMLEPDNDLYNSGIVDVSYKFEKMYVIRPQFFIPIITLLRNASLNSLSYKKQLAIVQNQDIDVANFEANINAFKESFSKNYELGVKKYQLAIEEIDKSIDHLQKIKAALTGSENNFRLANNKAQELSIKKLTKNAPSVAKKFEK